MLELLPALRQEWEGLQFDLSGRVVNPLTGDPEDTLVLTEGRHRHNGARYRVTVALPVSAAVEPASSGAGVEAAGRNGESTYLLTLHHDDGLRLALTVAKEPERWSFDVDLHHGPVPRVELVGRVDLSAALVADGTPRWAAGALGGTGAGRATVDLGALDGPSSSLVDAEGRANRFHGDARLDVGASLRRWSIDGGASLRGRGLGRLVLLMARRRIRRGVERGVERFWEREEVWAADVECDLQELDVAVAQEGGPAAFVRRALWDPSFDAGHWRGQGG